MEYYRAKTENGLLIQATIWMNFTLSERKQTPKDFIHEIQKQATVFKNG